jgi:hypothetical protein
MQSLGEEVRDEAAKRFACLLLAAFEIPQNVRVNIDRRSWHDALMINFFASDVKRRPSLLKAPFWLLQLVLLAAVVQADQHSLRLRTPRQGIATRTIPGCPC